LALGLFSLINRVFERPPRISLVGQNLLPRFRGWHSVAQLRDHSILLLLPLGINGVLGRLHSGELMLLLTVEFIFNFAQLLGQPDVLLHDGLDVGRIHHIGPGVASLPTLFSETAVQPCR